MFIAKIAKRIRSQPNQDINSNVMHALQRLEHRHPRILFTFRCNNNSGKLSLRSLKKFEEVCLYPSSQDEDVIADIHDCIEYQKVAQKYSGRKILSLSASTDGVALFNSSRQSLWAIQLYAHFMKPNDRYIPQNMIVVALYVGKEKPNMQDFFIH